MNEAGAALDAEAIRLALAEKGCVRLAVRGDSMAPTLRSGAETLVIPLAAGRPGIGEVVAVDMDGQVVLHRVVGIGPGVVVTQGDGRLTPDAPVRPNRVLGRIAPAGPGDRLLAAALALAGALSGLAPRGGGPIGRVARAAGRMGMTWAIRVLPRGRSGVKCFLAPLG